MPHLINALNVNDAYIQAARLIESQGSVSQSEKGTTKAVKRATICVANPKERYVTLDGRNNSIAAAIAETFWVLSGSKVISGWLEYFLHRAPLYSDDGVTWTRAYGPMLYQHNQWAGVIKYLEANPETRQAVLSIFDPAQESYDAIKFNHGTPHIKDRSCNNMLYFDVNQETKQLDLTVINRSNDVSYGVFTINFFEFSFLQELTALYLHTKHPTKFAEGIGNYTLFSNNLHVYLANDPVAAEKGNNLAEKQFKAVLANETALAYPELDDLTGSLKDIKDADEFVNAVRAFMSKAIETLYENRFVPHKLRELALDLLRGSIFQHSLLIKDYLMILVYELTRKVWAKNTADSYKQELEDLMFVAVDSISNKDLKTAFMHSDMFCPIK